MIQLRTYVRIILGNSRIVKYGFAWRIKQSEQDSPVSSSGRLRGVMLTTIELASDLARQLINNFTKHS
jgi:hypothetical protein